MPRRPVTPSTPTLSERIVILMGRDLVAEIDEYRWTQRLESRGDAIRILCETALKAENEAKGKKKPA